MKSESTLPHGGIDARKYAALAMALGMSRAALSSAINGDLEDARRILDLTASYRIASALGCTESDLAIVWDEHLSPEEVNRIKGY